VGEGRENMQIVSSLDKSRKLKELGFPQERCEFYYHRDLLSDEYTLHHIKVAVFDMDCIKADCCAAHTVEEMMVWLKEKGEEPTCGWSDVREKYYCEIKTGLKYRLADTLSDAVSDVVLLVLEKEKV